MPSEGCEGHRGHLDEAVGAYTAHRERRLRIHSRLRLWLNKALLLLPSRTKAGEQELSALRLQGKVIKSPGVFLQERHTGWWLHSSAPGPPHPTPPHRHLLGLALVLRAHLLGPGGVALAAATAAAMDADDQQQERHDACGQDGYPDMALGLGGCRGPEAKPHSPRKTRKMMKAPVSHSDWNSWWLHSFPSTCWAVALSSCSTSSVNKAISAGWSWAPPAPAPPEGHLRILGLPHPCPPALQPWPCPPTPPLLAPAPTPASLPLLSWPWPEQAPPRPLPPATPPLGPHLPWRSPSQAGGKSWEYRLLPASGSTSPEALATSPAPHQYPRAHGGTD
uniref:MAPK-interacting and spindle-stabilizing protein-like n=1 Tax=Tursiops truncatus TaxID=9739 RepID=A0A6J3Q1V8_TURTR|nr:MAPK-interacting and spindle-stabilizing protein-like [Tursiops truncatus]